MASVSDLTIGVRVNVSYGVDDLHTQKWRIRLIRAFALLLGVTLVCKDAEFAVVNDGHDEMIASG